MRPREQRVFTPDTLYDKYVAMAIERGKLGALERTPAARAALAVAPLRSIFLGGVVAAAKKAQPVH